MQVAQLQIGDAFSTRIADTYNFLSPILGQKGKIKKKQKEGKQNYLF